MSYIQNHVKNTLKYGGKLNLYGALSYNGKAKNIKQCTIDALLNKGVIEKRGFYYKLRSKE